MHTRLLAWGEKWRKWFISIHHTSKAQLFPLDKRKNTLIEFSEFAEYTINRELILELDRADQIMRA
jgi:hypothetical protein